MRLALQPFAVLLLVVLASGCTSDDYVRSEGPTIGAGNAQAANTAMQMVDPWQYGVQDTRLLVPAARGASAQSAADSATEAKASQTISGN